MYHLNFQILMEGKNDGKIINSSFSKLKILVTKVSTATYHEVANDSKNTKPADHMVMEGYFEEHFHQNLSYITK